MSAAAVRALSAHHWFGALWRALLFMTSCLILTTLLQLGSDRLVPRGGPVAQQVEFAVIALLAATITGVLLLRLLDRRRAAALGFAASRQVPRELGIGLVAGALPMFVITLALILFGLLRYHGQAGTVTGWLGSVLVAALVFTVAAAAEEVVYRGYAFQALTAGVGRWPALLLTSLMFAAAHGANPAVGGLALVNIFLAGVVLGIAYLRTLGLWLPTALHMAWNWSMASLLDLPVSGLTLVDTPYYEPSVTGAAWVSGREFGPEGGIVGTVGIALALAVVLRWRGLGPSAEQLAARPLPLGPQQDQQSDE